MKNRTVKRLHEAVRDDINDLVTRRPVPGPTLDMLDPFLFLNHHGPQVYPAPNHGLPFGPHPHRGFETVTFILDGDLMHKDSGGHESVIEGGGVQWMTAGSGLIHAELSSDKFMREGGPLEILQLWLNLPARLKLTAPRYTGLQRADIPSVQVPGGSVNVVSGRFGEVEGPVQPHTDASMLTVTLNAGGTVALPAPAGKTVFCYVVRGEVAIAGTAVPRYRLVELNDDGDTVEVTATSDAVLLYGHATPYREPVVSYGPFVMNTREEIGQAIADYQAGKFGAGL